MDASTKVFVGENQNGYDVHLYPGQNLYTGIKPFEKEFGSVDSLEEDLFNLASGIYGSDLSVIRDERENYIRSIDLTIEVVNFHAFERIKDLLERALFIVGRDNWNINFIQKTGNPVSTFKWVQYEGTVLLFSGGIDSMCAAAQFSEENRDLVLVSHNSHGNVVVDNCPRNVHSALEKHFERAIRHIHIKAYGRKLGVYEFAEERENTQRTRSFLFLTLAALVTRRCGFNKVLYMAENGQFAIHLPLNQSRIGPFSTHTADPEFIMYAQDIFKVLLNNPDFIIYNPYNYLTKAEVFALLPKTLQKESYVSASCWKISYVPEHKHCGFCIPCISRRIALEYNDIFFDEYDYDVFKSNVSKLKDEDDRRRNLTDYLEFIVKFKEVTSANKLELMYEFPELYNTAFDTDKALELYQRVASQSLSVFKKYPEVLKLIG